MHSDRLVSLLGLFVLLFICWVFSNNRRRFPWRATLTGLGLMFAFAILILKTNFGLGAFKVAQNAVDQLNVYATEGARLIFGPLGDPATLGKAFGPNAYVFAISISATIIVIAALSALLYHWGILQRVVGALAWVMQRAMKASGSESLAASSNIFLGQTEAALIIKPYLAKLTMSEMNVLMVTGFSTIATGVMVVYAGLPGMTAGDIVTASVLSSVSGLFVAKIMFPETEASETGERCHFGTERSAVNGVDALCQGAAEGLMLALNVMAMLLAFTAVVALANALVAWPQTALGVAVPVSFQQVLGWINMPFAWLMGVPWKDCNVIGQALGERIVLNEFIGFLHLSEIVRNNPTLLEPRSITLASYALCGFANFASIAIQIGGIAALAPERRSDLARLGWKAMFGGVLACYVTTAVVGILI